MNQFSSQSRREFLTTSILGATGLAAGFPTLAEAAPQIPSRKIKLGLDNFSVRAMKWNASQLIDYAASLKTDSLFITDLDAFQSFDESYLKNLRQKAADNALQIHVGTWSICPTSKFFKNKWGSAEEHLALGIRVAKALGSPVIRVILGMADDRKSDGGIEARIADTVKVCETCRSQAIDANVKIAVENHGGDMQAWELVTLIEAAGKDYVGANIDSGNAAWTMENPLENLETLAPYILTSSLRDSAIWETDTGATVQWTAMGEGNTDLKTYFANWAKWCPDVPVHVETISGGNREIPFLKTEFWKVWPKAKAKDFAQFLALAKNGKPRAAHKSPDAKAEQEFQKNEIERSIRYCKETLGLGLKT